MYFGATGRLSGDASKWATKILPALASFTSNCDSSLVCQNKTRQAGGGSSALVNGFYLQKLPRHLWIGQRGVNIHLTKTIVYLFKVFIKSWNKWLENVAQSPLERWKKIPFPLCLPKGNTSFHSKQFSVKPRYTAAVFPQFLAINNNFFLKLTKFN